MRLDDGEDTTQQLFTQLLKFAKYWKDSGQTWGSLHIVLDDFNVEDESVEHCKQWAVAEEDTLGVELAEILLQQTEFARFCIGRAAEDIAEEQWDDL